MLSPQVVNYYGPRIYAILGVGTQDALRIIGISGTLSIVYCTIMLLVVDKVGRIPPLIISTGGCAAALLVNAVLGQTMFGPGTNNQNALRAGIAMNFVFSLFFTPLGVISWVYNGEIYPTQIRAKGNSVATFTNWAFNLIFAQTAPLGLARYGFKFFYLFFVLGVIDTIALFFYPETKYVVPSPLEANYVTDDSILGKKHWNNSMKFLVIKKFHTHWKVLMRRPRRL